MKLLSIACLLLLGSMLQAAQGKHFAHAVLVAKSGATVASVQADGEGRARFTNVPPGEYKIVLTTADGRSVTLVDPEGGFTIDTTGPTFAAPPAAPGAGAGKVSVSSFNVMKAAPAGTATAPRDAATGMATGRRMHKPYCALVDWDGTIKGFQSEVAAKAEGERLPENANGRCAVKVVADEQPGTIEVQSWSWGVSQQNKTGHVTLMK